MKASYKEELDYLNSLARFSPSKVVSGEYELGLGPIKELLSLIGDPQEKLKIIHVAGTNGKGSTIAFLSRILMEEGLKVGVFTSPALLRVTEQIRINEEEIPEDDFAEGIRFLRPYIEKMRALGHKTTTEFETVTVAAVKYFLDKSCDIVILECGLGGKSDATNMFSSPILSVITSIGLDHTEILGDTLEKIAEQKAGIIKENGTAVVMNGPESVMQVFKDKCRENNASLFIAPSVMSDISQYELGLKGSYQLQNAHLARYCALTLRDLGLNISDDSIRTGLKKAKWPCRFEIINKNPLIVIDGSHNIDGVSALSDSLKALCPQKKFRFIVGVLRDKSYREMMDIILPVAECFYVVTVDSQRALPAGELSAYLTLKGKKATPFDTVSDAIGAAINECSSDDAVCIFGSLYYVGAAREILLKDFYPNPSQGSY